MADYSIPFCDDGGRRVPTSDEKENGFPCGPIDLELFNGLFHSLQAEIGTVVDQAGIEHTDLTNDRLYLAIMALIEAATGGGDVESYLLISQARARLPIFPDVQTANGTFGMTSPGTGQVRIPAAVTFLHRGIFPVTTVLTDFATAASKTYHVRWNPTDGFALKDVADVSYNPLVALETSSIFDSTYDNMLVARVITNSSNVPTITNLSNKVRLSRLHSQAVAFNHSPTFTTLSGTSMLDLNWVRTPIIFDIGFNDVDNGSAGDLQGIGFKFAIGGTSRYGSDNFQYRYQDSLSNNGTATVVITALAV